MIITDVGLTVVTTLCESIANVSVIKRIIMVATIKHLNSPNAVQPKNVVSRRHRMANELKGVLRIPT